MMKLNINAFRMFFLLFVLGVSLFSCNILDVDNPSSITEEYYNTKNGQNKLIVDIYAKYRGVFNQYSMQFYGTDMYTAVDESPVAKQINGYDKDFGGLSSEIGRYWTALYKIVQESNLLINRCSPDIGGDDYESMVAQGRFFRALAYYYLVETYGGVPLLLNENVDIGSLITKVKKESEENIYKFLIDEMSAIKGKLPNKASESGRLSNAAVQHFLGKLYLTRAYRSYKVTGDAQNAVINFEDVIASKDYKLLDQFKAVFDEDNQNNEEVIWAIQYGNDKNFMGGGNPQQGLLAFNIIGLYPSLFTMVQQDYPATQREFWTNPLVHEWFRYPDIDQRYDLTFKREFLINVSGHPDFGKMGIYMPRWNDESGEDKGAKFFYEFKTSDGQYNWYPALGSLGWKTDCMPMCHKFKESKIIWGTPGTREDVVIRIADTYLLCAEAYLLENMPSKALEKINAILRRAAKNETDFQIMKITNEADLTIDRLLDERGAEMFGEHDRWFDLKRTNTLLTRALMNPLVKHYNNLSNKHLVRPIPYSETIKLEGLGQNPEYN